MRQIEFLLTFLSAISQDSLRWDWWWAFMDDDPRSGFDAFGAYIAGGEL
jgi:hypothetical protein